MTSLRRMSSLSVTSDASDVNDCCSTLVRCRTDYKTAVGAETVNGAVSLLIVDSVYYAESQRNIC